MPDLDHPWLRPLWVRVLIILFCFGWAAVEVTRGSPGWGVMFAGLGLYGAWTFFGPGSKDR